MTRKEGIIDKWLPIISDDYMHFNKAQMKHAKSFAMLCKVKEYGEKGVIMWSTIKDIDSIKRTEVLLFYIKPEYRGTNIFLTMIKNIETIAIKEGAKDIIIGASISGYKEGKFNRIFSKFGYAQAGFIKRV